MTITKTEARGIRTALSRAAANRKWIHRVDGLPEAIHAALEILTPVTVAAETKPETAKVVHASRNGLRTACEGILSKIDADDLGNLKLVNELNNILGLTESRSQTAEINDAHRSVAPTYDLTTIDGLRSACRVAEGSGSV